MTDENVSGNHWWVCTDVLARGGAKVIGPFESQELALDMRTLLEAVPMLKRPRTTAARQQDTFWVDSDE
jgi:hypothetical protein